MELLKVKGGENATIHFTSRCHWLRLHAANFRVMVGLRSIFGFLKH